MAAALIDRLLYHYHIVSIRDNSYRMLHHTELYRALPPRPSNGKLNRGGRLAVGRSRRPEARHPLGRGSDFRSPDVSDY